MGDLPHAAFTKLVVTLWAIWWSRRKAIHDRIFQSPATTHEFINRFLADLEVIPKKNVSRQMPAASARVRQKAPPAGHAKIHVDGGVAGSKMGGSISPYL